MKTYRGVPFTQVDINAGFWQHRQNLNREQTVYTVMQRFAETGRFNALNCAWREGQPNKPHIFWDSDVAKWIESVAYILEKHPMPDLEKAVEEMIDAIEANQGADGYFNSYFTAVEPAMRWSNRDWHELYCAGHLMEAAIAWHHATGHDRFLKIMCRYADYIDRVFRVEHSAKFQTPGHEEIELALVKLYHATGEKKYLDLSAFFIDQRGTNDLDKQTKGYALGRQVQDHVPCAEQTTAEGHSVRACYLYSGMADIARERSDEALKKACQTLFDNVAYRRMYITAGIGSTHCGEAFSHDYDLPNQSAYTETCASISLAYFAHRMLMLEPDAKYADIVERVMYNGFLSSTSLDGKRFYYTNPMEIEVARRTPYPVKEHEWLPELERVEVFGCSCCPPNITRFVASIGDYIFTQDDEHIWLHQYIGSKSNVEGAEISIETNYPVDGQVRILAKNLNGKKLCLRIPGWCRNFSLNCAYEIENGYAVIDGEGEFDLILDMPVTLMEANPNVADAAGKAAVMRGPVVYCIEEKDNGPRLFDCMIDANLSAETEYSEAYHMPIIKAKGWQRPAPEGDWLYRPFSGKYDKRILTFIPYYTFANRGESDMRVWIPVKW